MRKLFASETALFAPKNDLSLLKIFFGSPAVGDSAVGPAQTREKREALTFM
jgi:hypothetical protein